jgi:uncharacterized protein YvpB/cell division protein FtsB
MRLGTRRRRSAPVVVLLFAGILVAAIVALAVLVQITWQRTRQVQVLQTQVDGLLAERQGTNRALVDLRSTATAMEDRLATLEASDPAQQLAALEAAVADAGDSQEVAALRATLGEIQARVNGFQVTLDDLASRIQALEPLDDSQGLAPLPPQARLAVPRQRQSHNLSCESSAASMVAQYHGLALSEAAVLEALPSNANPYLGFRGNVDGPTGGIADYGVYAGPIAAILNSRGLRASQVQGGLAGIKAAIARGNPVIAWVTYDCMVSTPTAANIGGQEVTLVPYQHVVVVTGYDDGGVWANDPWDGLEHYYATPDFERAMSYFGDMAVEVAAP